MTAQGEGFGASQLYRRSDIQGLRALAVIGVILFHADLPIPGGFTGVDIFFVISGFVITGMMAREHEHVQGLRLKNFYLRRFWRLTPALSLMLSTTVVMALFFLSPYGAQTKVAITSLGSIFLSANFVMAFITSGYFDEAAITNPLLHTWSLSVEDQFYLIFPAILVWSWARNHKSIGTRLFAIIATALLTALSLSMAMGLHLSPTSTPNVLVGYYSPFSRLWEFGVGALITLCRPGERKLAKPFSTFIGALGLSLVTLSFWLINSGMPDPGPVIVIPVIGAALLLIAGTNQDNFISKILGKSAFVKLGNWSYSLYLWHWPFIVFAKVLWPTIPYIGLYAALVSTIPALIAFKWVEQPLRVQTDRAKKKRLLLGFSVILVPITLAGSLAATAKFILVPLFSSGTLTPVYQGEIEYGQKKAVLEKKFFPCTPHKLWEKSSEVFGHVRCDQSRPGGSVDVAIVGDSHGEHLFFGFADAFPQDNIVYYMDGNVPLRGKSSRMDAFLDSVESSRTIKVVVLSAAWVGRGLDELGLLKVTQELSRSGKKVLLANDTPMFTASPFSCKYRQSLVQEKNCEVDVSLNGSLHSQVDEKLNRISSKVEGTHVLDTFSPFCVEEICSMSRNETVLYSDPTHLNIEGSLYVIHYLADHDPIFARLMSGTNQN